MDAWAAWKSAFGAWEEATARYVETLVRSPLLLEPAGRMMTAAMKLKAGTDEALARWWALQGLPTRREQERIMHALNQIQSRLLDLEERLEDRG